MSTDPLKSVLYCRVSSTVQREQGTIASQRDALVAYANQQGWSIVSIEEDDGLSGNIEPWRRPAMGRVLGMVEDGSVDVVLVIDVDRISRDDDNIDFPTVRKVLVEAGVKLATPRGLFDLESPEQRLFQDVLSALAGYERHKIRERMVRGRRAALVRGTIRPTARLPTGYAWDADAKRVVLDEHDAALVREVFRLFAEEKKGLRSVVLDLKARGLRTHRTYKGNHIFLAPATVHGILVNTAYYTGQYRPGYAWNPELTWTVPVIVDAETWHKANALYGRVNQPKHREVRYPFLLRGLVRCLGCGRKARAHTIRTQDLAYYVCPSSRKFDSDVNRDPCPRRGGLRAQEVDRLVWEYLCKLLREPAALQSEVQRHIEATAPATEPPEALLARLQAELRALDEARARIVRLCRDGFLSEEEARVELTDLDQKRRPLQARRELVVLRQRSAAETLARVALVHETLTRITGRLDELTMEQRRVVIDHLVEEVGIDATTGQIEVRCAIALPGGEPGTPAPVGGNGGGSAPSRRGGSNKRQSRAGMAISGAEDSLRRS